MQGIALANNCKLDFRWTEGYPATINDPAMADYVASIARQTFGNERFIPVARPSMGGEDFSYYLERVPGCFFLVGVQPADVERYPSLHSDRYDFTDAALGVGMRMFVELVMNFRAAVDIPAAILGPLFLTQGGAARRYTGYRRIPVSCCWSALESL